MERASLLKNAATIYRREKRDSLRSHGYFAVTANTRARLSERDHRTQKSSLVSVGLRSRDKVSCLRFEIGVNPCFRRSLFLRRVIVITTVGAITSASSASHDAISTKDSTGSKGRADCFFCSDRRRRCLDSRRPTREKTSGFFSQLRRVSSRRLAFVSSFDQVRPWIQRLTIDDYKRRWMAMCVCSGTHAARISERSQALSTEKKVESKAF